MPRISRPRPIHSQSLAALGLALMGACHATQPTTAPTPDASSKPTLAVSESRRPDSVHFTQLKPFLPDHLDGFVGKEMKASTSQFGAVAVSEIDRVYESSARRAEIRIVDTNLPQKAGASVHAQPDGLPNARPFASGSARGYFTYDSQRRYALASVVISDRFVIGVTVENSPDDGDVERLVRAMDLPGLGRLVDTRVP
jgi:hypothetical protein